MLRNHEILCTRDLHSRDWLVPREFTYHILFLPTGVLSHLSISFFCIVGWTSIFQFYFLIFKSEILRFFLIWLLHCNPCGIQIPRDFSRMWFYTFIPCDVAKQVQYIRTLVLLYDYPHSSYTDRFENKRQRNSWDSQICSRNDRS